MAKYYGLTALGKTIGTRKMTQRDLEYVEEHSVLKYLRGELACYLHDFRRHWSSSSRLRLPPPNGMADEVRIAETWPQRLPEWS